jgi:DNA-binding MarR family transcriptional regulator
VGRYIDPELLVPASRLTRADYEALANVRYRIRSFLEFSEAAAREAGIEPQQHQLLLALKALRPGEKSTIRVVAARLLTQHHSAVELVARCVDRGHVRSTRSALDRREVALQITARGERVLERLSVAHREELRAAAPLLLASLKALLARRRDTKTTATRRPRAR